VHGVEVLLIVVPAIELFATKAALQMVVPLTLLAMPQQIALMAELLLALTTHKHLATLAVPQRSATLTL
jgi:hypothetical protein